MSPVKVRLIGFGMASRVFHAPLISACDRLRLTHIVQRHGDEARHAYPDAVILRDVDDLLRERSVGLVVVATPNTSHFDLAGRALRAGKHVIVDKPFTCTSAEADELIHLARPSGCLLSIFHNRRWDGDFRTVQEILRRNLLGRLVEYESRFDRFRPQVNHSAWREQAKPGSGVLFDLGSHLIDQAVVLSGNPASVYADVRRLRDSAAADDYFEILLDYGQPKVNLKASPLVREPTPRFVLHGTRGSFVKYELDPQEAALGRGESPQSQGWGEEPESSWGILNTEIKETNVREEFASLPGCYPVYYENVARASSRLRLKLPPD